MNELRNFIQQKLEEIQDLEVTPEIPDNLLEKNITYFSYTLEKNYFGADTGGNYTYSINLLGYIKRLQNDTENTLEIVDNIANQIKEKLKELNIHTSFYDVSVIDGIRKIQVRGDCMYNEINNGLV